MKKLMKNFDFFSNEIKLTVNNNQTRYKNLFGGTLGLLTILAVFSLFIYFLQQFLNGEGQTIISNVHATTDVEIDLSKVPFMFRITDTNSKILEDQERIFGIKMKYWEGDLDKTGAIVQTNQNVAIEKCDLDKHFGEYRNLFLNYTDIDTFYCPVLRPDNYTVYGIYGDVKPFSYYHFYIHMCLNNTLGMNCHSIDYIKKQLANPFLEVRTLDYNIDNFSTKPNEIYVRSDRHVISYTVYKRIWMYLRNIEYLTDVGLVFKKEIEDNFFVVDSFRYDTDLRDIMTGSSTPGSFTTFTILNSQQTNSYFRAYMKAQNFLANVGGMLKGIMTIAMIINYFIARRLYFQKLINSTCDSFDQDEVYGINSEMKPKIQIKTIELNQISHVNPSQLSFSKDISYTAVDNDLSATPRLKEKSLKQVMTVVNEHNSNIENFPHIKKKYDKKNSKLLFIPYEYLCPLSCMKDQKKTELFLSKMRLVSDRMSIIYMLNLFNEFEKLKDLVLSPEQSVLLSLLPSKNIGVTKKIIYKDSDFIKCYNQIISKSNKNEIDKKILNILNR